MTVERVACGHTDQFPVGMRVLAVDDDPTCLRLLETLLRRCQYNVTTTNQAITALHLLRDSKNKFDLVISDVHMPDMDGFRLLELVGLEMDLPVIMLSANGDSKLVMKGITHGACDYLLKPIRVEQLKNIWQHVVRRKKVDVKDHNNFDGQEKAQFGNCKIGKLGNSDQGGKLNKKRKDNEDLWEEHDDDGNENEDPSTQKKPRVVWSPELHAKFVASVSQLGMDKAVPKKILELMNVDKLTRENVASHLQKYRLYLKRIANEQAHLHLPFSGTDSTYLRMGFINGYGNLPSLAASNQLPSRAYMPFSSSSQFGTLNTPSWVGLRSLPSSGMPHVTNLEDLSDASIGHNNFSPVVISEDFKGGILQGMPMSLAANEFHLKGVTSTGGLPAIVDNVGVSSASSSFIGTGSVMKHSNSFVPGVPSYPMLLDRHVQEANCAKLPGDEMSVRGACNKQLSSDMVDLRICGDNWSFTNPSELQFPSNDHCLRLSGLCPNDLMDSLSVMGCNSSGQIVKDTLQQLDAPDGSNLFSGAMVPLGGEMEQGDMFCCRDTYLDSMKQANFLNPLLINSNAIEGSGMDGAHQKRHGCYSLINTDCLEDLMKQEEQVKFPEGKLGGCAPYSFRKGI